MRNRVAGVTERSASMQQWRRHEKSIVNTISADGRYVAFSSVASNLVPDDTNGVQDVFLRDRVLHTTVRLTDGLTDSGHTVSLSADGHYLVYGPGVVVYIDSPTLAPIFSRAEVVHWPRTVRWSSSKQILPDSFLDRSIPVRLNRLSRGLVSTCTPVRWTLTSMAWRSPMTIARACPIRLNRTMMGMVWATTARRHTTLTPRVPTDGDGCTDGREVYSEAMHGGQRSPGSPGCF